MRAGPAADPTSATLAAPAKPCPGHQKQDPATALAVYIQQLVDSAPPLSAEQQDRLAVLLAGSGAGR